MLKISFLSKSLLNFLLLAVLLLPGSVVPLFAQKSKQLVDYVNPYMGNISHLLVPTYPTIHLPNSLLRVYPQRDDFTGDRLHGLPLIVSSHRGRSAFNLSPYSGDLPADSLVLHYSYSDEKLNPYSYAVFLDDQHIEVEYAVSEQAAIYQFAFGGNQAPKLRFNAHDGTVQWDGKGLSGVQDIGNHTKVYIYAIPDQQPEHVDVLKKTAVETTCLDLIFPSQLRDISFKYGISFIGTEQAKSNLNREIDGFDLAKVRKLGREKWNTALSKVLVETAAHDDKVVFYTSMYRTLERPVNISEDGRYFSAFDGKVHDDNGIPFYTDDWIWDSYRAHHPLNVLMDPKKETYILQSFVRMAQQMTPHWLPTFPEINGDSRRMNSNHGIATLLDAYHKGILEFDLEMAYQAAKAAITEKTLAPWSAKAAGKLDAFFKEKGYFPALAKGEEESSPEVDPFEKRQPVAVTLGTSYDLWCLAQLAAALGHLEDHALFLAQSFNYRNLFHPETKFFHPKDSQGKFLEPFDYVFSGGQGARGTYGENNGWIYRWDVQHNISDLISMMGGNVKFIEALDNMFNQPLGKAKFEFYAQLPDHTGNVGQFSMANEPSLHIPYLYNYAGAAWKTQKRIRNLVNQWFRNDLMGVPGDEDGGGMSAFVVFSQLGFYPVTPGKPIYSIGSPFFKKATLNLPNGKRLLVKTDALSSSHIYIRSARLNGKALAQPEITHQQILAGGILEFSMSDRPTDLWQNVSQP